MGYKDANGLAELRFGRDDLYDSFRMPKFLSRFVDIKDSNTCIDGDMIEVHAPCMCPVMYCETFRINPTDTVSRDLRKFLNARGSGFTYRAAFSIAKKLGVPCYLVGYVPVTLRWLPEGKKGMYAPVWRDRVLSSPFEFGEWQDIEEFRVQQIGTGSAWQGEHEVLCPKEWAELIYEAHAAHHCSVC